MGATSIVLLAAPWGSRAFTAPGADREWTKEVPCCFLINDQTIKTQYAGSYVIELDEPDHHAAEMRLTMPAVSSMVFDPKTGRYREVPGRPEVAGFDPGTGRYTKPSIDGYGYALLVHAGIDLEAVDARWRSAPRAFLFYMRKGPYRLEVFGVHDGRYSLTFHPVRWRAGESNAQGVVRQTETVPIKAGEVQEYEFSAETDPGASPPATLSVRRLDLKRVK